MQKTVNQYIRSCQKCQIMNLQKPNYINLHPDIAQTPQDHISIDLIGPYNITLQGNLYTIMVVCNPYTRQKDSKSSCTLVFRNNAQI